ncbi:MAG: dihydrofolate reductase [Candidatus Doudnabacteria bacterium]|nr:dihydrofolate reductase [Candidatus Doudnabacteria bacterium]
MNTPKISLIAAVAKNLAIGKDNKLLYYIPSDLKRFKQITSGHVVIMGKKTFESMDSKPLPNRQNIVIALQKDYEAPGCITVHSIDEAFQKAKEIEKQEIFVIGGGSIYAQTIKHANKLYITVIDDEPEGADAFFPPYDDFKKITREEKSEHDGLRFTWFELEKE